MPKTRTLRPWPAPLGATPVESPHGAHGARPGGADSAGIPEVAVPLPSPSLPARVRRWAADFSSLLRLLGNTALAVAAFMFCLAQLGPVNEVTPAALEQKLAAVPGRTLLFFWQPACPGSREMEPLLAEYGHGLPEVPVLRINALANTDIVDQYEIRGTPTLLLMDGRREVARHEGALHSQPELVRFAHAGASH